MSSLRDRWYYVVLPGLILGVCAMALSLLMTPVYSASATMYVTSGDDSNVQAAYQGSLASQQRIASYAQLASSDAVISNAVSESRKSISSEDVRKKLSTSWDPDTVLLNVTVEDSDRSVAVVLANSVAASLQDYVESLETPAGGGSPMAKLTTVTPAVEPSVPVSPGIEKNTLIGVAVGLLFGLLAVMFASRLTNRIQTPADVVEVTESPVLAVVPRFPSAADSPVSFGAGSSPASEAYRRLRTNLSFIGVDSPHRRFAVTSALEGEGKTTTAVNLAVCLSEVGYKVVVVDADLRRPMVAVRLGVNPDIGFTDFLSGRAALEDVLQSTSFSGVDALAGGQIPPNPAELLTSQKASEGINSLSSLYDYVIVDTPPVLPVTDAVIASRLVDGVIVVVRSGASRRPDLESMLSHLGRANAAVVGVVLGDAQSRAGYYANSYALEYGQVGVRDSAER
ncbi:polysaccharide biosynthesis tyrosine autokinase [Gordonia rubripertincta]|uniref:polysaccharide biosynthesis tyrosine autokinase n=1 Tax=Gordonia rubripertincta TaxID=36822 RepID=UPI002670641B|nr:polysaccharide biosynthesis tyrosine autokinase [Gordonia rubripertincta]